MDIPVTSLSIGLLIHGILDGDKALAAMGIKGIHPCYNRNAENGYPFIIFNAGSSLNIPVKSNAGMDEVSFTVESCAKTYEACVNMSEGVRAALEGKRKAITQQRADGATLTASQMTLRDVDEFYDLDLDCYVQKLQFSCKAWGQSQDV